MSLLPLENPLTRLNLFPNTMNYRGGWSATVQYYANDVIVSNLDNNTYILTGKTTLIGGGNPSTNADWEAISSTAPSQVLSITADPLLGVENTGTAQNVVLVNTGVISIETDPDTGIQNTGDANNQELVNTGILSVTTNPLNGINNTNTAQNPILFNTGVISIVAQNGCTNTGTATDPIIDASGIVLSCAARPVPTNGGVVVDGTPQNPTFSWEPLASGVASLAGIGVATVLVTVPYNLTENSFISLTMRSDMLAPPGFKINGTSWRLTTTPNVFQISVGQGQNGQDVQWALLSL